MKYSQHTVVLLETARIATKIRELIKLSQSLYDTDRAMFNLRIHQIENDIGSLIQEMHYKEKQHKLQQSKKSC